MINNRSLYVLVSNMSVQYKGLWLFGGETRFVSLYIDDHMVPRHTENSYCTEKHISTAELSEASTLATSSVTKFGFFRIRVKSAVLTTHVSPFL